MGQLEGKGMARLTFNVTVSSFPGEMVAGAEMELILASTTGRIVKQAARRANEAALNCIFGVASGCRE